MKIVIIGAGSMAFSASLFNSVTRDPAFADCELCLVDINAEALEIMERLAYRLVKERNLKMQVRASLDRRDLLPGAEAVTTTIAVGGLESAGLDVRIPGNYGCIQPVGDTTGPGGLGRALRHVPEIVAIAEDMADLCPEATLYNYTNPLTVLTRAVNKYTPIHCIGLCIGPELTWRYIADFLGVDRKQTWTRIAGINHCHWLLQLRRGSEDLMPWIAARLAQLRGDSSKVEALAAEKGGIEAPSIDPFRGHLQPLCLAIYESLGYFPGPGDWHVGEFFPQFFHGPGGAERFNLRNGSVVELQEKEHPVFFEKMRQQAFGEAPLSEEMFGEQSYGEESEFTAILSARRDLKPLPFHVNTVNNGSISNLPDEAVVEVPCLVNSAGITPLCVGKLPNPIAAPLGRILLNDEVIIEAAMKGSRKLAVRAYLNDPYCSDLARDSKMINELIDALLPWLPRFTKTQAAVAG